MKMGRSRRFEARRFDLCVASRAKIGSPTFRRFII